MNNELFDLTGKVALVTGASRGIGESSARLLADNGAHVIVTSRNADDCQSVVDSIAESGATAEAHACDMGSMEDIDRLFSEIEEKHGRLDILFNNAGTGPNPGHILDTDRDAFQMTVDVNVRGCFFASIAAAKLMRKNDGGSIINNASTSAISPGPGLGIYSVTKGALVNMTKAFAKECAGFGIRVNAVLPGLTKTEFAGPLFENKDLYQLAMHLIPMHRHGQPSEISGAVLFLASDASSYVTGQSIVIDGGMTS